MRNVKRLLLGVLTLTTISVASGVIPGCIPRYTCKEAPLNCLSCRTITVSYKVIPATLLDMEDPLECGQARVGFSFITVTKTDNTIKDMQAMISEYKRAGDYLLLLQELNEICGKKLQKQMEDNLALKRKYCIDFKMEYAKDRGVCIPKKEK